MIDVMTTTQVLALLIGLYMLSAGVGVLLDREGWAGVMTDLADQPALAFALAWVAFAIGAVIVAVHNDWSSPLAIVISLVGWAALIEGMALFAFRRAFLGALTALPIGAMMLPLGIFALLFGVWLVYAALT